MVEFKVDPMRESVGLSGPPTAVYWVVGEYLRMLGTCEESAVPNLPKNVVSESGPLIFGMVGNELHMWPLPSSGGTLKVQY